MKKTAIIVIVMLIAMFFVTCDEFFPNESKVEYTDVEYSEDGSRVTIYLDGVGVPVTAAQRAMSTRLSKMAYDYLEVIFSAPTATPATTARAQWELGQSAGISGVVRGVDYIWGATKAAATANIALLAVGRKEGKTLLGIGQIGEVDNSASSTTAPAGYTPANGYTTTWATGINATTGMPNSPYAFITSGSKSVTFYVESVKTGLIPDKPTAGTDVPVATFNSFTQLATIPATYPSAGFTVWPNSTHTKLGNSYIPTFPLPSTFGSKQNAFYVFTGAAATFKAHIIGTKVNVEPRFPRYLDNGQYRQLSAAIDMRSDINTTATAYTNEVPLEFEVKGTGIFSFYIEMPVQILVATQGTNTGKLDPVTWKIRTGLGSELYSLDDGVSGGGCALMTIGTLSLEDWLEIQWEWVP